MRFLLLLIVANLAGACSRPPSYESQFKDRIIFDFTTDLTHDEIVLKYHRPIDALLRTEEVGFVDGTMLFGEECTIDLATNFEVHPPKELIRKLRTAALIPVAAKIDYRRESRADEPLEQG
ncbi:MAG: hypothetical protein EOP84_25870 [Verrucomicrobiaceae bacterium]|nr:MAG: hypothetical protein EOP84_25870 [Verrucomicrobiaceae bacterium]